MEQSDDEPPPFWLGTTTPPRHANAHHRRSSSLFLNTGMLVLFLIAAAVVFLAIVIPSGVSLSRQVFNPTLVKSSWNSLNIVLVIFAIVCGFLSRKDDDQTPVNTPTRKDDEYSFGDLETVTRLRRSSSSYPDLRHDSNLLATEEDKLRFYDDTHYRRSFRKTVEDEVYDNKAKIIEVDTFVRKSRDVSCQPTSSSTSSNQPVFDDIDVVPLPSYFWPSPPPPPPPPPPPRRGHSSAPTRKKTNNQTFETIGHGRYIWKNPAEAREPKPKVKPQQQQPPPPPLPTRLKPVVVAHFTENKKENNDRRRGGGVNVTKDFFSSLYHPSKTKKKHESKRRSYENLENLIEHPKTSSIHRSKSTPEFPPPSPPRPPAPAPPPPPPSPHSVFHTLFYKKGKNRKKVHSTTTSTSSTRTATPPPPPPPPPPPQRKRPGKSKAKLKPPETPTKPFKNDILASMEYDQRGDETPLRPILPPPPPPPPPPSFKKRPWKFNNISPIRSGYSSSSEDDGESSSSLPSLFSPSPDVNIKADDFIARFRANLDLEKSDSINLRQRTSRLRLDSLLR